MAGTRARAQAEAQWKAAADRVAAHRAQQEREAALAADAAGRVVPLCRRLLEEIGERDTLLQADGAEVAVKWGEYFGGGSVWFLTASDRIAWAPGRSRKLSVFWQAGTPSSGGRSREPELRDIPALERFEDALRYLLDEPEAPSLGEQLASDYTAEQNAFLVLLDKAMDEGWPGDGLNPEQIGTEHFAKWALEQIRTRLLGKAT